MSGVASQAPPARHSHTLLIFVLGVLTAFVGTPLFLWQLVRSRRSWQ